MEGAAYMIGTDYTAAQAERYTGSPSGKMKKTDCVFMEKIAEQAAAGRDMTPEEYKQYFQKQADALYTHPSQAKTIWMIDITDAAYGRMRQDAAYERRMLDWIAKEKAADYGNDAPGMAYMHIDDAPEKCRCYIQRADGRRRNERRAQPKEKSWWEKRTERMKEHLEAQIERAQENAKVQSALLQRSSLEQHYMSCQKQQTYFKERDKKRGGMETEGLTLIDAKALAAAAYEDTIRRFSAGATKTR